MITIQLKIEKCQECPKCKMSRTPNAGYAFDYFCTESGKMIEHYVEYRNEEPRDVPDWCPLKI